MAAKKKSAQLELPIKREPTPDRNASHGGRSIYLFDFDDNVMHLDTPIYIFDKKTGEERAVSTGEFAQISPLVGKEEPYLGYEVNYDDSVGSFRRFRDNDHLGPGERQPFVDDLALALAEERFEWKGPSWSIFHYAVFNRRPISIITARGHGPQTIRDGIQLLFEGGYVEHAPNYLSVYPVSHPQIKEELGGAHLGVPELKKEAIIQSVQRAMELYGDSPHHRFGMSDDSAENIELVIDAMKVLKKRYPHNAFFVIDSSSEILIKTEILSGSIEETELENIDQLDLF